MRPALAAALAFVAFGCATAPRFAAPEPVGGARARLVLRPTWSEPLGDAVATAIASSPDGGVVVGIAGGEPRGPSHAQLAKYDRGEDLAWSTALNLGLRIRAIAVAADGRIFVLANQARAELPSGARLLAFDGSGALLSSLHFDGVVATSFARTPSGGFVLAGSFEETIDAGNLRLEPLPDAPPPKPRWFSPHEPTAFLAEMTASGEVVWAKVLGHGRGSSLAALPGGDVIEVGSTFHIRKRDATSVSGVHQGHVARLGPGGAARWVRELTSDEGVYLGFAATDPSGGVVVTGDLHGALHQADGVASRGQSDVLVARLAADGTLEWAQTFGGPGWDEATAITVARDGTSFVAGSLGEATSDGRPARTSPFVVGLDPKGRVVSSQHFGYRAARSLVRGAAVDRDQQLVLAGAFGTYAYWRDPAEGFLVWLEAAPRTALR